MSTSIFVNHVHLICLRNILRVIPHESQNCCRRFGIASGVYHPHAAAGGDYDDFSLQNQPPPPIC